MLGMASCFAHKPCAYVGVGVTSNVIFDLCHTSPKKNPVNEVEDPNGITGIV